MDARCRRCGEDAWAPGTLGGGVRIAFRPDHSRFLTLETGSVDLRARMCTVCGSVELIGDVAKLERIHGESAAAQE